MSEDPHVTAEKTEDVRFVAQVTQLMSGIQPTGVGGWEGRRGVWAPELADRPGGQSMPMLGF